MSGSFAPAPFFTYSDSDLVSAPIGGTGYASTLPVDAQDDTIERLHRAVKDVTGRDVEVPDKPRMGFL